jgi:folate-binding protein YgfZ
MAVDSAFAGATNYAATETRLFRGVQMAGLFGSAGDEYNAARQGAVVFDRSHRGLIVARGADRKTWLNNLVTNAVATLGDNEGNYAFATDVKGRTQFDLNVLSTPNELWLDIDLPTTVDAKSHLERYLIVEDVELEIASDRFARLACAGPTAKRVADALGVGNFAPMAALASAVVGDGQARLVRHDFVGMPGFELIVPASEATAWWDRLIRDCEAVPVGVDTAELLRVEAGIPAWGADIDQTVIPPETGQIERGISYVKGCYLGQEIIERMRSYGSIRRRLVRLATDDGDGLDIPAPITQSAANVGRVTSLVRHPTAGHWIALGYLRTSVAEADDLTVGDPPRAIHAIE